MNLLVLGIPSSSSVSLTNCWIRYFKAEHHISNSCDNDMRLRCASLLRKLQRSTTNREQLRYLSGEWFYETKQLRHQDRIHGSDLIRASMRQTYRPLTICEFLSKTTHQRHVELLESLLPANKSQLGRSRSSGWMWTTGQKSSNIDPLLRH